MAKKGKVAVLYTGGKDSTYICGELLRDGYTVSCLVTVKSINQASYMLHTSNISMTKLGAAALELPIIYGETQGNKESELYDISETIRRAQVEFEFSAIASGALASNYQKQRIERIAKSLDLGTLSPLWGRDQAEYLTSVVSEGYNFVLTSVSCYGLDESFLGRVITPILAEKIIKRSKQFKFNPAFEGGEAETFVLDCPLFRDKRIKIVESRIEWDGYSGSLAIQNALLEQK
jgi:diphthine-ammonia ligase